MVTGVNPLYQLPMGGAHNVGAANAGAANAGAVGNLGGHAVQMAPVAQQPAQPSGIGEKIKSFFAGIKHAFQDLGQKLGDTFTFKPLGRKIFDAPEKGFDASKLSQSDRLTGSYAFVKDAANSTDASNIGAFMRGNTNCSKMTAHAAIRPETTAVMQSARDAIQDATVAIDKKSYGLDFNGSFNAAISPFAAIRNAADDTGVRQMAQDSVALVDRVMCGVFGTPGDAASIAGAADRFPQSLCDQLATLFAAVDDSNARPDLRADMKLHLARDALVLRSINPAIAQIVGQSARNEGTTSLMQLSKAVQSLVNGVGMGNKDTHPEVTTAGAHMQDRWNDSFPDFIDAIVARADTAAVDAAAHRGNRVLDART